ncbi:uncharacterized protein LOC108597024 isoform X2 [Drosophila busckii]|uniref:uncharacterized protein LOC108597024 isoform X2 n=1 Tax=Drosophila busckii TaxID=30019 RepID=UPI00083EB6B3|nr:uncharacterized protein LOC108597024 isoform X2 [Drosophila busckii]
MTRKVKTLKRLKRGVKRIKVARGRHKNVRQVVACNKMKLTGNHSIAFGKIPAGAIIKPMMKRAANVTATTTTAPLQKVPKYVLSSSSINGTTWQAANTVLPAKRELLGDAINSLPANTIIKATSRQPQAAAAASQQSAGHAIAPAPAPAVASVVRQAVILKRDMPQRTMRSITLSSIDACSMLHLGVETTHLPLFKRHVCKHASVTYLDCCITLRKLRLNESFALLAEFFELSESDVEQTFKRTLVKLSRCLRPLIRWADGKHFSERLKHMPLAYRANLMHVRSLIECVETDVSATLDFGCDSYKFILCLNTNGIISYVSDAFRGDCDDLQLFEASNFKNIIPSYLTLCAEPGKGIKQTKTAGAEEDDEEPETAAAAKPALSKYSAQRLTAQMANQQSLNVVDGALSSSRAKSLQLPTVRINEPACRAQMRHMIDALREFKMLDHCALQQTMPLGYLNEMLIVAAALCNLQSQ